MSHRHYAIHPAAGIVPLLEGDEYEQLKSDIGENGQQTPIAIWQGQVIDGRNRLRACGELGIEPKVIAVAELPQGSPARFVLSANLHRRHLSPSQLAIVAARAREQFDHEASQRRAHRTPAKGDARDIAGSVVGVSGKLVDYASKVLRDGVPEVIDACTSGRLAVSRAAEVAKLPPAAQRAELSAQSARSDSHRSHWPQAAASPGRNTSYSTFDKLVARSQELERIVSSQCGAITQLLEQGLYDLKVLEDGLAQIERAAQGLDSWARDARRELRPQARPRKARAMLRVEVEKAGSRAGRGPTEQPPHSQPSQVQHA